jgi:polyvinyl alcohol dehydrogenase (cytochrome)
LHDAQRTGNASDPVLSVGTAPSLAKVWSFSIGTQIAAAPTVVSGTVFIGSWDGYEYALDALTGALKWKTYLGTTTGLDGTLGVTSSPTVDNGVLYVGGGDASWYALDPASGHILWSIYVGDNSASGGYYGWSSPLIYRGDAYIGTASLGDDPLVQGKLLQVDLATHQIVHAFKVVPDGQIGGSIWTSPSVDPATNTIYVTTGNNDYKSTPAAQPDTVAILALDAGTLDLKSAWQVPSSRQAGTDSDWTTTPILFADGSGRPLVAAVNKGGWLFAFDRSQPLSAGPLWQVQIAGSCAAPENGCSSASTATFANGTLFQAGGQTIVQGTLVAGSVRALDPTTGLIKWTHAESNAVLPALVSVNGLVIAGAGPTLEVLAANTGTPLFSYKTGGTIYGPAAVSSGHIYVGSTDGTVYAFGLTAGPTAGMITAAGASSSYAIMPATSGSATIGSCAAVPITNQYSVAVYGSSGRMIASSANPADCNWGQASVTAGQTYTVTTKSLSGTGPYLSAWAVNGATVTWPLGGTIATQGGVSIPSVMTLSAKPITASICGPSGTIFDLYLMDVHGHVLQSATAASNCQSLTYTPMVADMFRIKVVAASGSGRWTGKVTTQ